MSGLWEAGDRLYSIGTCILLSTTCHLHAPFSGAFSYAFFLFISATDAILFPVLYPFCKNCPIAASPFASVKPKDYVHVICIC